MKTFLSYSTPVRTDQLYALELINLCIGSLDSEIVMVNSCPEKQNPIFQIIADMKTCDNFVSLVFSKKEYVSNNHIYQRTSPWLDIELALALQLNIPCIVIRETKLEVSPLVTAHYTPCDVIEMPKCIYSNKIELYSFEICVCKRLTHWIKSLIP